MKITLEFDNDYIDYLKEKFDIENKEDLEDAIWEMINTYMEM